MEIKELIKQRAFLRYDLDKAENAYLMTGSEFAKAKMVKLESEIKSLTSKIEAK